MSGSAPDKRVSQAEASDGLGNRFSRNCFSEKPLEHEQALWPRYDGTSSAKKVFCISVNGTLEQLRKLSQFTPLNKCSLLQPSPTHSSELAEPLSLSATDVAALYRQGSVCAERRGARTVHKLRFRVAGKQIIRWLGSDSEWVERVRRAVERAQAGRRAQLTIKRQLRALRRASRAATAWLKPIAAPAGVQFHGTIPRRPRSGLVPQPPWNDG